EERFRQRGVRLGEESLPRIRLATRRFTPLREVAKTLFVEQRRRPAVGLALMIAQAFFYNAIFFTYALVLTDFYSIRADHVGWYLLPVGTRDFLRPGLRGHLLE